MRMPWDKIGNIAQITVAACAIATLFYAIRQSSKTAELLANVSEVFTAQALPVIRFDAHNWGQTKEGLGCSNPASALLIHYRNFSGVPVAIEDFRLNLKRGNAPLLPGPPETEEKPEGDVILPAGVRRTMTFGGPVIVEAYKRLSGRTPPYLNFELIIIYRSLASAKRYHYTGIVNVHDDCDFPRQTTSSIHSEKTLEILAR